MGGNGARKGGRIGELLTFDLVSGSTSHIPLDAIATNVMEIVKDLSKY